MTRFLSPLLTCAIWLAFYTLTLYSPSAKFKPSKGPQVPDEQFMLQRTYPDYDAAASMSIYGKAMHLAAAQHKQTRGTTSFQTSWRLEGPGNIGARFNSIVSPPGSPQTIYAGACLGGIFKTTNGGQTWLPIFDDRSYLSIGDIAIDPSNPNTIYAGTGDENVNGYVYYGDGLYRSTNGGNTWQHLGLEPQKIISRIIIHPTNPNILYVGTMGNPFQAGNDRGVYKSIDGGVTWTQALFVNAQAGIIDMVIDPTNPNILYAASFDRLRTPYSSTVSGPNCKIWKTTNGGTTWSDVSAGLPSPCGRIGLAISQQNSNTLVAIVASDTSGTNASDFYGIYKSTNGASTWTQILDNNAGQLYQGAFAWYFGQIRFNPLNDNEIWALGVNSVWSNDGGANWADPDPGGEMHADKHDLIFISGQPYMATDGGLYKWVNQSSWQDIENIPVNQFYRIAINPHQAGIYYGGVQDNGSIGGDYTNMNSWLKYWGGDGFQMRFDPTNPNIFYAESQYLGLVYTNDGGQLFNDHTSGIDFNEPAHWSAPFIISASSPLRQYTATQRVYRTIEGAGGIWEQISPILTKTPIVSPRYHTVTTVDESPVDNQTIWAGTTDGNAWVSTDDGANWNLVSDALPNHYITSIVCSPNDKDKAYITHSGYRANDNSPHIHKTSDNGQTWQSIAGDMLDIAINDVVALPSDENILFIATDAGVYGTLNGGANWEIVGNNLPILPVYDVEIDPATQRLVAGTFGRSMYSVSLDSLLSVVSITPSSLPTEALSIFPNPATDYLHFNIPLAEQKGATLSVFDMQGKEVIMQPFTPTLFISHLQAGTYAIRVENKKCIYQGKFIKP